MDGDLSGQSVNVGYVCHHQRADPSSLTQTVNLIIRSSILQGASMPVISGGEFNSFGGDYNHITINICKAYLRNYVSYSRTSTWIKVCDGVGAIDTGR